MHIAGFTITRSWNLMITINGDSKRIVIGNLVKTRINGTTTISIKINTTTFNMIVVNIVFITLVNDLKLIYLIIIELSHVIERYD